MRTNYTETQELYSDDSSLGSNRFGTLHLVSRLISAVLHPLVVPTWLTMMLLFVVRVIPTDTARLWIITGLITTFTLVMPLFGIYIMLKSGYISDSSLVNRGDRVIPMFFTAICFCLPQIFFFDVLRYSSELIILLYSMTVCVIAGAIITIWYKISAHAISIGGVLAFACFASIQLHDKIMLWPLVIAIIASGGLLSARLYLNIHSPMQVFLGWLLGIVIASTACMVYL